MSIFEGIGSLDNRARAREQLWIPPFAETELLYFDLCTSPILVEPCRRRDDSKTALPCRDLE
jgi:hypothetical protein